MMCESKMISKSDDVDVGCGNAFGGKFLEWRLFHAFTYHRDCIYLSIVVMNMSFICFLILYINRGSLLCPLQCSYPIFSHLLISIVFLSNLFFSCNRWCPRRWRWFLCTDREQRHWWFLIDRDSNWHCFWFQGILTFLPPISLRRPILSCYPKLLCFTFNYQNNQRMHIG